MLVLEPIPALSGMLLSLKMAKLGDDVGAQIAALEARTRPPPRSSDGAAWALVYREALALIPRVLEAQARLEREREQAAADQAARQRLGSLAGVVPQRLQGEVNAWAQRLQTQVRDLREKADRSAQKLVASGAADTERGETVYQIEEGQLQSFWAWLAGAEKAWCDNNRQLVAVRSNEAIADVKGDLPASVVFEVGPADLSPPPWSAPRLKGFRVTTPGRFEALGNAQRVIMSVTSGSGVLLFGVSRIPNFPAAAYLPWVTVGLLLIAVIYAAVTVPTQHRQALARQQAGAQERVQSELLLAVRERLDRASEAQLAAIKKHLAGEGNRWSQALQKAGAGGLGGGMPLAMAGLSGQDVNRLRGEWRDAIAARLAELEAGPR